MIEEIINISDSDPYKLFISKYEEALEASQNNIEAVIISSYNNVTKEVDARLVNLKYIINDEWIFFSNYNSPKAKQFYNNDKISSIFFWPNINTQIRLKSIIKKTSKEISDSHFAKRDNKKNALAISSNQSMPIKSYEIVEKNYKNILNHGKCLERPEYWGGFSFFPYYFEFWEGHDKRLNKRIVFEKNESSWKKYFIQP